MKQYSLIFSLMLFSTLSFSQDFMETFLKVDFKEAFEKPSVESMRENFRYGVYPFHIRAHRRPSTELGAAKSMLDLIDEYPSSWVSDYVSTEVSVVSNGQTKTAIGANETLTKEQKELLEMAEINSKVAINIKYKQENGATRKMDVHTLNYLIMVMPETRASYPGGPDALDQYLKENVINRLSDADLKEMKEGIVEFTINEKGQVEGVGLMQNTGRTTADKLLLKVIYMMPQWEAAKDAKGMPVKQQFKFAAGNWFGGC
jgi:hypothetical protein